MRIFSANINQPNGAETTIQIGLQDQHNQNVFVNVVIPAHALEQTTLGHLRKLALEKAATIVAEARHGG